MNAGFILLWYLFFCHRKNTELHRKYTFVILSSRFIGSIEGYHFITK